MKINLHTHSTWCDGKDTPERMAEVAYEKGFDVLGFSSHAMWPFEDPGYLALDDYPRYFENIRALAEKWRGKLEIRCGVEADYCPGTSTPDRANYAQYKPDYIIGSIHMVPYPPPSSKEIKIPSNENFYADLLNQGDVISFPIAVDETPEKLQFGIRLACQNDAETFVRAYFQQERDMVQMYDFDIIGHPDLVRKFNTKFPYFDENADWYREELELTAEAIAASGKQVEINTGGISRGWITSAYPSDAFQEILRRHNVPFIHTLDAHSVNELI